jgi:hypothetical protein
MVVEAGTARDGMVAAGAAVDGVVEVGVAAAGAIAVADGDGAAGDPALPSA